MTQLNPEVKIPLAQDPKLHIMYDRESDTLTLHNGLPAGYGATVAEYLTAELNGASLAEEGEVVGMTLEHAADLLRPYLFPESVSNGSAPAEGGGQSA